MDENEKNKCIKVVKQRVVDALESGKLNDPRVQYDFVEDSLYRILVFDDKKINKVIWQYFEDQDILKKSIDEKQKELQKLMDEYGDNVKEIYEMIKKI